MADLVITGGSVLTMDADLTIIPQGAVAATGGRIEYVGPAAGAPAAGRTLDAGGGLILPGLVNAHTHVSMTLMRGLADDLPLETWLTQHIFPTERNLTPEAVYWGAMLASLEMIKGGVTAFHDMYLFAQDVARAADDAGLRAVVGEVMYDFPSPCYGAWADGCALSARLIQEWADHPRVHFALMPHALYTCGRELMTEVARLQAELGAQVNIHMAETAAEIQMVAEKWGQRPLAVLQELGLLGPQTLLPHSVHLDDAEIEAVAAAGARVAHCPESNMKLASGMMPLQKMLDAGITVGLGTDGCASNNDQDLFGEMDTCAKLAKARDLDPTAAPAPRVLAMATSQGARAAGLGADVGTLAVGNVADVIVVDTSAPHMTPMYNPYSHLVYVARASDVRHTVCHGRVLMADRMVESLDQAEVMAKAHEHALKLSGREVW